MQLSRFHGQLLITDSSSAPVVNNSNFALDAEITSTTSRLVFQQSLHYLLFLIVVSIFVFFLLLVSSLRIVQLPFEVLRHLYRVVLSGDVPVILVITLLFISGSILNLTKQKI